jgi:serine/threonine protein kinase
MTSSLRSGTRLGPYRIVAPLGAGGMGEVYRAHDAKLDRPVALKILPAEVVRDAERIRRFVQEAKAASSLSHPNIVTIYDIGEAVPREAGTEGSEGDTPAEGSAKVHFIAMELVEGQTLRQLLDDRSIEPRTLLAYLAQAAEGLAKAHAAGIVHRDLKPENVMVSRDGYAKVLDFGLAKLTEPSVSGSALAAAPTALAEDNTRDGAVMGTIGYMSPEQAMGKPVDHRTDLFAFGCLLYEAATGKRPFTGESSVDVLHAIVRETPTPVEQIAPQIPRALVRRIRRCLEKDPAKRAQSMKDLAFELHDLTEEWETLATPSGTVSSASSLSTSAPPVRGGIGRAAWLAIGVAVVALGVTTVVLWRGRSAPAPVASAFQSMQITAATSTGNTHGASISPDGRYLTYLRLEPGGTSLWLRLLATGSDVRLLEPPPQSVRHYRNPVVSPDGNYVYYSMSNEQRTMMTLYRMPVLGGATREIAVDVDSRIGFSPDGRRIAFLRGDAQSSSSSLILANADGSGDETTLATRSVKDKHGFFAGVANIGPVWSPEGRSLAVPGYDSSDKVRFELVRVELDGGRQTRIGTTFWIGFSGLAWLPDGSALIVAGSVQGVTSQTQLWRVPLASGEPVRITNDSQYYVGASSSQDGRILASVQGSASSTIWRRPLAGAGEERQLSFSNREHAYGLVAMADGSLAYSFLRGRERGIARLSGDGGEPFVLTRPGADNFAFRVSRDGGTFLALSLLDNGRLVIRAMDRDGGSIREITSPDEDDRFELHPDGTWFVGADSKGLWRRPLDGGESSLIVEDPDATAIGFSPDGGRLAYESSVHGGGSEVTRNFVVIPATGGAPVARVPKPDGPFFNPEWAPDGKALTLRKFENQGYNLWRLPLDGSPIERLTDFEGVQLWDSAISPDGKTLFFTKGVQTQDAVLIESFR